MNMSRLVRPLLERRAALALAGVTLASALLAAPAQAQVIVRPFYYGGTWSGPLVMPVPEGPQRLPLDALYEEIGDQGYRPLRVLRHGRDAVIVEAIDPRARRVRLTVDPFDGEILERHALATPPRGEPRSPLVREVPEADPAPPTPPRRRSAEARKDPAPKPPAARPAPGEGLNPDAQRNTAPVAPARDPSLWGKQG